MSNFYGICDSKREKIYSDKLQIFLSDFFRHSKQFKEEVVELKQLITRIESLASKIITLENFDSIAIYSNEIIEAVLTEAFSQASKTFTKIHQIVNSLLVSYQTLHTYNTEFVVATNKLDWLSPTSPAICGNHKQKPLKYYKDNSAALLFYYKIFIQNVSELLKKLDIRDSNSIEVFKKSLSTSESFDDKLEDFLLFSSLINKKP